MHLLIHKFSRGYTPGPPYTWEEREGRGGNIGDRKGSGMDGEGGRRERKRVGEREGGEGKIG
jgi:hypothetical protein